LEKIKMYFSNQLSPIKNYYIEDGLDQKFKKIYRDHQDAIYYSKNIVRIYFPQENTCIICSEADAYNIPVVQAILEGQFQEQAILFQFRETKYGMKLDGCKLIIVNVEMASIILENGKAINEMFHSY